jgi:hypothetical protein
MTIDNMLHLLAGLFIMASVALGYYLSPYFYLFTIFVGLNLFQSAFSHWCPMMTFLRRMGFRET